MVLHEGVVVERVVNGDLTCFPQSPSQVNLLDRENAKLTAGVAALRREAEMLQTLLNKTSAF